MGKIFDNLDKWQNYAHYILLAGAIFIIHYLTDVLGIEANAVANGGIAWVGLLLFYALGLFVFDTLIHAMFYVLPKPYRWRD